MKKLSIIALCILCSFGLIACTDTREGATNLSSKYVHLEVVENADNGRVLMDTYTGVLYLWYKDIDLYGQTLTPLYNADGSLKNIADYEEEKR